MTEKQVRRYRVPPRAPHGWDVSLNVFEITGFTVANGVTVSWMTRQPGSVPEYLTDDQIRQAYDSQPKA